MKNHDGRIWVLALLAVALPSGAFAQVQRALERAVPGYGNYCGPTRDGSYSRAGSPITGWMGRPIGEPGSVPPMDQTDAACKRHDQAYARQGMTMFTPTTDPRRQRVDSRFIEELRRAQTRSPGEAIYNRGAQGAFSAMHSQDGKAKR